MKRITLLLLAAALLAPAPAQAQSVSKRPTALRTAIRTVASRPPAVALTVTATGVGVTLMPYKAPAVKAPKPSSYAPPKITYGTIGGQNVFLYEASAITVGNIGGGSVLLYQVGPVTLGNVGGTQVYLYRSRQR